MSAQLPAPPVPPDLDVSALDMLFSFKRFFGSDLLAIASNEEIGAATKLWGRAWLRKPASSLPDNDRQLAALSGAGKRWPQLRANALHGFKPYADGLLYHPVIAKVALDARAKSDAFRARAANATEAKRKRQDHRQGQRNDQRNGHLEETVTTTLTSVRGSRSDENPPLTTFVDKSTKLAEGGNAREARPAPSTDKTLNLKGIALLDHVSDMWNSWAKSYGLPAVDRLTDERIRRCETFVNQLSEYDFETVDDAMRALLHRAGRTFFLNGKTSRPLTFDQLMSEDVFAKIFEGAFDLKHQPTRF